MDKFIAQRHKNLSAPESVIFDIVRKATNKTPIHKQKIVAGYDNEVYLVTSKEGNEFILRINRFGEVGFRNEAWAIEECRKSGVPVPEIFFLDDVQVGESICEVMLTNKFEGRPLGDFIKTLSTKELEAILEQAGRILRKIHSIKVGGFYRRHTDGSWDFSDWDKYMDSVIRGRNSEKQYVLDAGFTNSEFTYMIDMLKHYKINYPCHQPVLNHGDYLPEHIFVTDEKKISGIIDFGMIEGNTPIHDFAFLDFERPDIDISILKKGYGDGSLFDDSFDIKLNMHKLALQIGHLSHNVKIGDSKQAKWIAGRLRSTVEELKILNFC